jgi:hypothetical protein
MSANKKWSFISTDFASTTKIGALSVLILLRQQKVNLSLFN